MSDETKSLMPVRSPSAPGTVGLAGQQMVTGKWIRFWIALSLTLSPSGAFAQQTSAKVQTNDKAAWLGKGNGNKGTDSTAPTDPNYVIGPQDALDNAYYIYKDFNGNTRSGTGGCWDLGAYQHWADWDLLGRITKFAPKRSCWGLLRGKMVLLSIGKIWKMDVLYEQSLSWV
jgi:hypothetical protein